MDENESGSDSTSSTLTLNSVVDADAKAKDGAATNGKGGQTEPMDKKTINAQKLSDEVHKVCKNINTISWQALLAIIGKQVWMECECESLNEWAFTSIDTKIGSPTLYRLGLKSIH